MKKLNELRTRKAALIEEMTTLHADLEKTNRSLTSEELTQLSENETELTQINESIISLEKLNTRVLDFSSIVHTTSNNEEKEKATYSIGKVMRAASKQQPLDGLEAEIAQDMQDGMRGLVESKYPIPQWALNKRGFSVTQDTGLKGGNTVPNELGGLIEFLSDNLILSELGIETMSELKGDMKIPKESAQYNAAWEGEVTDADEVSQNIGSIDLTPKRLAAWVDYTLQLLAQSDIVVEKYSQNVLRRAIANKLNWTYINGLGTGNEPMGILAALAAFNSGSQIVPIGTNGGALTYAKLVTLETLVSVGNASPTRLLTNSKVRGAMKTISKDAGSGIFLFNDNNLVAPVLGMPLTVTNAVRSNGTKGSGTNLSSLICGDFSQSILANWGDIYLDVESRGKNGKKEIIVNSFWDFKFKQETAFAAITDITT